MRGVGALPEIRLKRVPKSCRSVPVRVPNWNGTQALPNPPLTPKSPRKSLAWIWALSLKYVLCTAHRPCTCSTCHTCLQLALSEDAVQRLGATVSTMGQGQTSGHSGPRPKMSRGVGGDGGGGGGADVIVHETIIIQISNFTPHVTVPLHSQKSLHAIYAPLGL